MSAPPSQRVARAAIAVYLLVFTLSTINSVPTPNNVTSDPTPNNVTPVPIRRNTTLFPNPNNIKSVPTARHPGSMKCQKFNTTANISIEDMKPITITMALIAGVGMRGDGMIYGGTFMLALDELKQQANASKLPVTFDYILSNVSNMEVETINRMLELGCKKNVSVFIGPQGFCKTAGIVATSMSKPYIGYGCEESVMQSGNLLYIHTKSSILHVAKYVVSVMTHFKWTSFWLVRGNSIIYTETADRIEHLVADMNITMKDQSVAEENDEYIPAMFFQTSKYRKIIEESRRETRVYVYLGSPGSLMHFLMELSNVSESGEYVVLAVSDSELPEPFYKLAPNDKLTPEKLLYRRRLYRNVLIFDADKKMVDKNEFESKIYRRSTQPPFKNPVPPNGIQMPEISPLVYTLYDGIMFFGQAVLSLMSIPDLNPEKASDIISYIRCRRHDSIMGYPMYIHADGETESGFRVLALEYKDGAVQDLHQVGTFDSLGDEKLDMPLYHETAPIHWILGHPPLTEPLCGFDNSKCPIKKISDWVIATSVSAIILFVMILVVSLVLVLRHCIYEKKLDRLAWKIDRSEIQLLNDGQFRELTTPARPRKKDSLTGNQLRKIYFLQDTDEEISEKSYRSEVIPVGFYRGTYVVVKQVTRKHMEVNRMVKKQLQMRKELTHDNINRFIGACVEPPNMFIVTQYCPRKSLQDLLNDECSPIDDMFTTSLVQDLIRGMTFIHDAFGYHGNLKSSNCLVDSRWTLKVTDFGYTVLGPEPRPKVEDESFYKGLLWTAPELLRNRRNVSTSSHQPSYHHMNSISSTSSGSTNSSLRVTGSAKGDVYSFAIILNELYGRAGPWGLNKMTAREIVERLMVSTVPEFRPDTSNLTTKNQIIVSLIHECWHQNPEVRPDFKYGIRAKFKPIQQGFLKSNIFDNMIDMMEKYANNLEAVVAERTEQLRVEKRMTENLLLRMLPRSVAEKLKHGHQVEPEQYEHVSIYFSDIVGFTQMSASSTPMEVVDLLNDLYTCFDSIIEEFDVYKVETIGDAYMVVSGLPIRNGDRHAGEIASMALLLLEAIKLKRFKIQGSNNTTLKIRIGIHSGPCCAGVVGLKMPRYCLFGDTVNTANRLESTGEALKIHCSADTKKILDKLGGYHLEERGYTEMKGKGSLLTYFLLSEDQNHRYRRLSRYKRSGNTSRCVSASNLDYSGKSYSLSSKMFSQNPDRVSTNSSLNSSMDSSDNPEDMSPSYMAFDDKMSVHLPSYNHDFVASTLPRATLPKYNGHMSPIAECPGGQSECSGQNESLLEKTVSFPNSPYHEGYSETVSLLNGTAQWPDGPSGVMAKKRSISSRSGLNHSKPNGWAAQWFADPNVCHLDYTSNDESTM